MKPAEPTRTLLANGDNPSMAAYVYTASPGDIKSCCSGAAGFFVRWYNASMKRNEEERCGFWWTVWRIYGTRPESTLLLAESELLRIKLRQSRANVEILVADIKRAAQRKRQEGNEAQ